MVDGHYLNLPVVDNDGKLVAIVDVLKLTYATLEQVSPGNVTLPSEERSSATLGIGIFGPLRHRSPVTKLTGRWRTWPTTRPTTRVDRCGANSLKP